MFNLVAQLDNQIDRYMPDKPIRPQLNIRLDKHPGLLDEIKQAASDGYAGSLATIATLPPANSS
ncbi:hypothetical protein [Nostoc sp. NMS4]|uniref:hypothetical protein n=1 Tax=Nostoc sp. NMS4 TaxID=2815390 RepID=UPI0025DA3383|nr:hypothetical protein [Nostoc sp. NMS4]MBN3925609.1 hypothetical protein [Nostoc sp. NMS4]